MRVVGAAIVATVGAVLLKFRRQVVSWLTHWKRDPAHTEPYAPFPATDPPVLRVAVAGDVGEVGHHIDATGRAMADLAGTDPFDVLLLLGDNAYPRGDPRKLRGTVFEPFASVLRAGTELLAIIGNHDVRHADEQLDALGMPGRWWSARRGDVLLVGLDSDQPTNTAQLGWLEETLQSSDATWRIVAVHQPPWSAGYQGSSVATRRAFAPLFERHGVQLVLSGHEHDYQRSVPINGVTYVVTGSASRTRRTGEASFTAASFSVHGYVELGIYPDRLIGRALDLDNCVADSWVLRP